jgi:hypothetical protein
VGKSRIPIDLLNATALANHVVENLNLDVNAKMGLAGIKAKLAQAGMPVDYIEIDDGLDEPAPPLVRKAPPRVRHRANRRSVQLRIEPQEKPGGSEPVFASVNGIGIWIPRAETCWLDYKYYHVLMNAVAHIAITDDDSKITGWRKVPEYPVSVFLIEPPLTKAEKAAAIREEAEEQERLHEEQLRQIAREEGAENWEDEEAA